MDSPENVGIKDQNKTKGQLLRELRVLRQRVTDLEHARFVAQSTSSLKLDFLSALSHELRTPLNIIMGYNDLLLAGDLGSLSQEQQDVLKRVDRNARELLDLIATAVDVARLESGRLPLDLREIKLAALLTEMEAETRERSQRTGLRFSWHVTPRLPLVTTDPTKFKIALRNLLGNLGKAPEIGKVIVNAHPYSQGVEISVTDTGIDLEPAALPLTFAASHQSQPAKPDLFRHQSSLDLKLSLVRRLLDLLGGTFLVESSIGQGSTFRVRVPTTIGAELIAGPGH